MRFSATQLESFRLFMEPEQEWMSEAELTDTLSGILIPNHKIKLGQAFGRVLESPMPYAVNGGYRICVEGEWFEFGNDVMAEPLKLVDRCGVFEAKAVKAYGPHEVASRADYLCGSRLSEFKTTLGSFDFDKYADSYQWRFMADAFQPSRITYHVFLLAEASNGVISLRGIESFHLYRYDALQTDCAALVDACAVYCGSNPSLAALLTQRQQDAA